MGRWKYRQGVNGLTQVKSVQLFFKFIYLFIILFLTSTFFTGVSHMFTASGTKEWELKFGLGTCKIRLDL